MRRKNVFPVWYLWAVNNHPATNEYIATGICEQRRELVRQDVLCADGKRRNLFICPRGYNDVKVAIEAIPQFQLKLEVFKEDIEDVIVRYTLWRNEVKQRRRDAQAHNRLLRNCCKR